MIIRCNSFNFKTPVPPLVLMRPVQSGKIQTNLGFYFYPETIHIYSISTELSLPPEKPTFLETSFPPKWW